MMLIRQRNPEDLIIEQEAALSLELFLLNIEDESVSRIVDSVLCGHTLKAAGQEIGRSPTVVTRRLRRLAPALTKTLEGIS